MLAFIEFIQQ